jgi:hypothetical protein
MKDSHAKEHMAIALAIRNAKRKLFKLHREGIPLRQALDAFVEDAIQLREETVANNRAGVDDEATEKVPADDDRPKTLIGENEVINLARLVVSEIEYDRKRMAPIIAFLHFLTLAQGGDLYSDSPVSIRIDTDEFVYSFLRALLAFTLEGSELTAASVAALKHVAVMYDERKGRDHEPSN